MSSLYKNLLRALSAFENRSCGKTEALVKWATEKPDRVVIVATADDAFRLKNEYKIQALPWSHAHQLAGARKQIIVDVPAVTDILMTAIHRAERHERDFAEVSEELKQKDRELEQEKKLRVEYDRKFAKGFFVSADEYSQLIGKMKPMDGFWGRACSRLIRDREIKDKQIEEMQKEIDRLTGIVFPEGDR